MGQLPHIGMVALVLLNAETGIHVYTVTSSLYGQWRCGAKVGHGDPGLRPSVTGKNVAQLL